MSINLCIPDSYDQVTNKLIIECNIKTSLDLGTHRIRWYKDDVEVRQSFVPSGGIPTTYEHEHEESSGKVKLVITYPMNSDCGLYRCCLFDKNNEKLDEISHLVYKIFNPAPMVPLDETEIAERKKRVLFENYLSDITAEEGSHNIRLNCKISQCNASSDIKWYKNNEELLIDQLRDKYHYTKSYNRLCLEIKNINSDDGGAYECRVQNQYNEISSKCNVHVYEKVERNKSRTVTRGKFIHLLRHLITHIQILFIFHSDSNHRDITSEGSVDIEDIEKLEYQRERGKDRQIPQRPQRQSVFESNTSHERPLFATEISDRTITENSSSVKFTCSVLSTECDISWEKNGIPIRSTSKYRQTFLDGLAILELFDVSDDDAGKYSCIASNKHGESITSAKLKVYLGFKPSVCMPPTFTRHMKGRVQRIQLIIQSIS